MLGAAGTAGWAFERKGVLTVGKEATEDQLMDVAVGAGADDYQHAGDEWHLTHGVRRARRRARRAREGGIKVKSSSLASVPKIKKPLAGRDAQVALNLAEVLDDHDDVQNVFADFDISDEELATLESLRRECRVV